MRRSPKVLRCTQNDVPADFAILLLGRAPPCRYALRILHFGVRLDQERDSGRAIRGLRAGIVGLPGAQRSVMSMNEVSEQLHENEAGPPVVSPKLLDTADAGSREERSASDSPPELPLPRWLFNLIGHILAALLGLVLGYLILALLRPLTFPLPWYH